MNKSKAAIGVSRIVELFEKVIGILWAVFWGSGALISMFDDVVDGAGFILLAWLLCAAGIALFLAGLKRGKMVSEFRRYVVRLSADPTGSIDNLAASLNVPVGTVKKNLKYMIRKNFFVDAYIDEEKNCLVLPGAARKMQQESDKRGSAGSMEMVTCTCSCCGATNRIIKGSAAVCDYCGSPISS